LTGVKNFSRILSEMTGGFAWSSFLSVELEGQERLRCVNPPLLVLFKDFWQGVVSWPIGKGGFLREPFFFYREAI
jgi:hypothetical protein